MSDHEDNLKILTDHVRDLAGLQEQAAGRIKVANEKARGISGGMWGSHGVVCAATNMAVSAAEEARTAAGKAMYTMSNTLAERLKNAADNYDDVDMREGRAIGACSV